MKLLIVLFLGLILPFAAQADLSKKGLHCVGSVDNIEKEIYYSGSTTTNSARGAWRADVTSAELVTDDGVKYEGEIVLSGLYKEDTKEMMHLIEVNGNIITVFTAVDDMDAIIISKPLTLETETMLYSVSCVFRKEDAK